MSLLSVKTFDALTYPVAHLGNVLGGIYPGGQIHGVGLFGTNKNSVALSYI